MEDFHFYYAGAILILSIIVYDIMALFITVIGVSYFDNLETNNKMLDEVTLRNHCIGPSENIRSTPRLHVGLMSVGRLHVALAAGVAYHQHVLFCSMASTFLLRHHLMLWRIFAPKV